MNGRNLLNDKFTVANLPRVCLPRRKLLSTFDRKADKRLIFVSAPAGYGKTVSAQLWLAGSGREVIWISLDGYDNTPSIFYKLFCTGILSVQPENKAMAEILASRSFVSSPVEHTIRLLAEFIPDYKQYALVLDDMHLVTNKELHKSGLLVWKRLPLSFATLILTRNEVSNEFTSVLGDRRYAIIKSDDLAFSAAEIQRFFMAHGRSVTIEGAEKVRSFTGGWAIGVNALALSGRTELEQDGVRILGDYIKNRIWSNWNEDLREFMLKSSVLDEMPVELCEAITGRKDSREVLENLCETNSFVSKTSRDTYRYHHLFLEFLRNQLREIGFDAKDIYKMAAYYYIGIGELFIARRYARQSEDAHAMINVLHQLAGYGIASLDEFINFSKMYEGPSERVFEKAPFLYATHMWENYLLGNAAKMEFFMDKLYEALPVLADEFPQYMETVLLRMSLDHRRSLYELAERFETLFADKQLYEDPRGATLTHELPFLHRGIRDYCELTDDTLRERLKSTFGLLLKENLDIVMFTLESGLFLEKNMIKEALEAALMAESLLKENSNEELGFCIYVHLTAVYYAMRDSKYNDTIAAAERLIEKSGAHNLHTNFMAFKTTVQLMDGNRQAAADWLENYFVTDDEHLELYKIYRYFTTAKAYIVLGKTDNAMNYIVKLKQLSVDFRRPSDIAEAGILQAILEWAEGRKREAQSTLEDALLNIQDYDFIRVAAIEGAAILPILRRLSAKTKKEGYQGPLKAHYIHKLTLAAYEQSTQRKGVAANIKTNPIKLSKRQKVVLSLLAKGYTYSEVMNEIGLTIHTVKSHASCAYRKLGVHNSLDAAVKARELGIIE